MNKITVNELMEFEEKLRVAMLQSDVRSLDMLLSEDLIFTNHLGQVISRADDLEGHNNGDFKISNISLSDFKNELLDHVAIISVKAEISGLYKGTPSNGTFRFTRVWLKRNNVLQVVAGHACMVA